jgi:hypothetical protein
MTRKAAVSSKQAQARDNGLGNERPHQFSCGMGDTGIGLPAAKQIISVLVRG